VEGMLLTSPSSDGIRTPAVEIDSGDTDWGNDGVLQWDGVNGESAGETDFISSNSSATRRRLSTSPGADWNSSVQVVRNTEHMKDTTVHNNSVTPKSLTKSNSKASDYIPLNDPIIDAIFTQMILNDEPLYLRVLRYEVGLFSRQKYIHTDSLNSLSISTCFSRKPLHVISTRVD
jgi:hypothetical protein